METSMVVPTNNGHENGVTYTSNHQRRPSKGGWKSAIFIIFVEVAERFANYGVSGNLITYLTNELGESIATAAKNVNIWHGVSAMFPLLGAFLADSYLGRFNTILLSSITFLVGLVLLVISVAVIPLKHRRPVFFAAIYILAVGEGGHMPCVQTFAADQFDEDLPEQIAAKSSFFNWWYIGTVFGSTAAVVAIISIQDYVGWAIGFGIPAVAVGAALIVFLAGIKLYRREIPVGSPFTRVAQVIVAAIRKRRLSITSEGQDLCYDDNTSKVINRKGGRTQYLARTDEFRFLEKATIIDEIDKSSEKRNHWRLCSVNQVEEVKLVLRLLPVWFTCLVFMIVQAQLSTYFTKQGSTMNRSLYGSSSKTFQVPPATLQVITGMTILIAVPIYDRIFIPFARKFTGNLRGITILQRIGIGNCFSTLTMVISALVESKRVSVARDHGLTDLPKSVVPMRIWWLFPQYFLLGISDMLTIVGLQELFYDQMHEEMRSMGAAVYLSILGVGSFLSSGVIAAAQAISERCGDEWLGNNLNRAHIDYFYWLLAGMNALSLCCFVWVAKRFVYKKLEKDGLSEGNELL